MKSLGILRHPKVVVESYNPHSGLVVLKIFTSKKSVKVEMQVGCVRTLTDLTHTIVEKVRQHVLYEQQTYERLKKYTSYTKGLNQ